MESFYGGRPGFPFILRGKKDGNSYVSFKSKSEIEDAIDSKDLVFGDYAIIGGNDSQVSGYGEIYRVNENKELDLVGRLTLPALSTELEIDQSIINDSNVAKADIQVVDSLVNAHPTIYSKQAEVSINGENYYKIKMGISLPQPDFITTNNVDLINSDGNTNSAYMLQVSPQYLREQLENLEDSQNPFTFKVDFVHPPVVQIKKNGSSTTINTDDIVFLWEES